MHQVELVAHEHDLNVLLRLLEERIEPEAHILKGLVVGDVIDDEAAEGLAIVGNGDGSILFSACCVPQLCLHEYPILHNDILRCELDSNRRTRALRQRVLQKPAQQACLAHINITNEDD